MSAFCPAHAENGAVRALLENVDCTTRHYAEAGFVALTGAHSFYPQALTTLLTIVVALLGYRLLFGLGAARLQRAPLLALEIGAVLAVTLQWPVFQTLVFDLAYKAPLQVAQTVLAEGAAARDPLAGVQNAYGALLADAAAIGKAPSATAPDASTRMRAAESLDGAAQQLFLATAGALSAALVTVGVLSAVGPVFVALALFGATRGLFFGWVRALLAAALAPMLIWGVTALLVQVLQPSLAELATQAASLNPDFNQVGATVAIIDAFALAMAALVAGGLVVALGFRPGRLRGDRAVAPAVRSGADAAAGGALLLSRPAQLAERLRTPAMSDWTRAGPPAAVDLVSTRRTASIRFERPAASERLPAGDGASLGRRPAPMARRAR